MIHEIRIQEAVEVDTALATVTEARLSVTDAALSETWEGNDDNVGLAS